MLSYLLKVTISLPSLVFLGVFGILLCGALGGPQNLPHPLYVAYVGMVVYFGYESSLYVAGALAYRGSDRARRYLTFLQCH